MATGDDGGRVFFSNSGRSLVEEDEIRLLSVGVDIGSATSHVVFSRLVLERLDNRYVVVSRDAFFRSEILLTPYAAEEEIDAEALGGFLKEQYRQAGLTPEDVDTGALILTGVAVGRRNARAIGGLFAGEAGKLVAVSAGDALETTMAAHGSGAIARSIREQATILHVDIGGGTAKIAVCAAGKVADLTAVDVGARLIVLDGNGRIMRIEAAGRHFAAELGLRLDVGTMLDDAAAEALAERMADGLFAAVDGDSPRAGGAPLLRIDPLSYRGPIDAIGFSGGVAEYIYGRESGGHGDLGPALASAIRRRVAGRRLRVVEPVEGIRATVIGASQHTVQVSGSTIHVSPPATLPLRNLPVIAPDLPLETETIDADAVSAAVAQARRRLDLVEGDKSFAVFVPWRGSASYHRLDAFCRGVTAGLADMLARGHALVLAGDGDVGGLIGMHCREELRLSNAIVSIDGIELREFDYLDIGAMLTSTGAVPVVIKSLIFPASAAVEK